VFGPIRQVPAAPPADTTVIDIDGTYRITLARE
jgi:hypothetical protein